MKDKIDIDKLLVVTFTNAAASEMRERVLDAIYKMLDENPEDENLQKQIILLSKSNICTIHSFCLDVIRNHFFEIDLPANFRIASEEEINLLKQEALEEVFEELYEAEDAEFEKLIESYTGYRGDEPVKDIVFQIYHLIQSMPFPKKWLEEKVALFRAENYEGMDFSESIWGKILLKNFREEIEESLCHFKQLKKRVDSYPEMEKYSLILNCDIDMLQNLLDKSNNWDAAYEVAGNLSYKTWSADKKITLELKDEAKDIRNNLKKKIKSVIDKTFLYCSEEAFSDVGLMYEKLVILKKVVYKFEECFQAKKRKKNVIDFSDIEHFALQILVKETEDGRYVSSDVAKKYQEKFEEIAIDEYQDSNQVQELILKSVSRGNNIFMVGDVKQSIYKFRQACPKLFLEKYENYSLDGNENGLKIQLFKNFRSSQNILDITNTIFQSIMSKQLGEMEYDESEYLNLGADYPQIENGVGKSELHIINLQKQEEESDIEENEEDTVKEEGRELDKIELEARLVTRRIQELVQGEYQIKCKNGTYKSVEYRDIVILLRSTANSAGIFEQELIKNKIPVFSDTSSEFLDTIEVQTILNVLKIIDNPFNDIELVAVMRSKIGGFSDNEIVEIRLLNRDVNVYENLKEAEKLENKELYEKVQAFLQKQEEWRRMSQMFSLAELIWKIYEDTGFLNYVSLMQNGSLRVANLRMLFERAKEYEKTSYSGLFHFIQFIEKLRKGSSDMASAKIIGENENVVRIMSIHKSKGLEFPVVFLCQANKKVNLQDLKTNILLHNEIGFGPQYIDYERKIQYPTAAKQAIKLARKRRGYFRRNANFICCIN